MHKTLSFSRTRSSRRQRNAARNWIDEGIKLGMTEDEVSAWFAKGKRRRRDGKTEAPVRPDYSWKEEALHEAADDTL
jgi:hypothetical protein